jgi:membrane protein required for colicin V production
VTALDVLLLVVLALFAVRGFWRGFVRETMGLVALAGGIMGAALWADALADWLQTERLMPPELGPVAAGALVFLLLYVGLNLVGAGLDRMARRLYLTPVLRITGVLFATVKGAALLGVALLVGHRLAPWVVTTERLEASRLAPPLVDIASSVIEAGGAWLGAGRVNGV